MSDSTLEVSEVDQLTLCWMTWLDFTGSGKLWKSFKHSDDKWQQYQKAAYGFDKIVEGNSWLFHGFVFFESFFRCLNGILASGFSL